MIWTLKINCSSLSVVILVNIFLDLLQVFGKHIAKALAKAISKDSISLVLLIISISKPTHQINKVRIFPPPFPLLLLFPHAIPSHHHHYYVLLVQHHTNKLPQAPSVLQVIQSLQITLVLPILILLVPNLLLLPILFLLLLQARQKPKHRRYLQILSLKAKIYFHIVSLIYEIYFMFTIHICI